MTNHQDTPELAEHLPQSWLAAAPYCQAALRRLRPAKIFGLWSLQGSVKGL